MAILSAAPTFQPGDAIAANRTWGVITGNWATPGNWIGGIVPAAGDQAIILHSDIISPPRVVNYDYTGPQITLFSVQLSGGANILSQPATLNMPANTLSSNVEQIGINGIGIVNQSGGFNTLQSSSITTSGMFLGVNATARGTYNLSGGNFQLNTTQAVIGQAGIGSFNQTGGSSQFNGLTLGQTATGAGTYTLGGPSQFTSTNGAFVIVGDRGAGTFIHNDVSATVTRLRIGLTAGGRGNYFMNSGNLQINNNSSFDDANMEVGGAGDGTFTQTGGNVSINTARVGQAGMQVGNVAGGTGTYILSGGSVNTNDLDLRIGNGGTGIFIHSGGVLSGSSVNVGIASSGRYSLSGTGVINTTLGFAVSDGTMTQSGGQLNAGNGDSLSFVTSVGQLGVTGVYQMSGGTINVNGLEFLSRFGAGTGSFVQTGGVHNVTGVYYIGDVNGLVPGGVGTYQLSGGRLNVRPAVLAIGTTGFADASLNGLVLDTGGTIVGGAADGVFAGRLTQRGGTIAGTFRNEGTIVSRGGAVTGTLVNRVAVTLDGGTMVVSAAPINNENTAIINGNGTISGSVINRGVIAPTGAMAISTITNTDGGEINIATGSSLTPIFVNSFSRINLAGGALRGGGQVSLNPNASNGGAVLAGGGTIECELILNGGILRADLPSIPLVVNSIDIEDPTSQIVIAPNSVMTLQNPLANGVTMNLQGAGARLTGATVSNLALIQGAGEITSQVVNSGVIRATGGELLLSNPNGANLTAGQIQTGNSTVRFSAGLQLNNGIISMAGGAFDNGVGSLTNAGTILGRGTLRGGTLNNNGTITLSGGVSDVFMPVNNANRINLTGSNETTFYQPVNTAVGTLNVNLGSTAVFLANLTGVSHITGSGVKDFEATVSAGAIETIVGTTIVGPTANVAIDSIRDDTLNVVGRASINANGTATGASRLKTLLIDGFINSWVGQLDLKNNALVIDYTGTSPAATIANQLRSGRAGGAWNGNGIASSTAAVTANRALGFAEASAIGSPATFFGQPADATSILIRYTINGDANLSGGVNISDFALLAANFNASGSTWVRGDFNYDGVTNITDFALLASNFNQSLPVDLPRGSSVPEPAALTVSIFGVALLRRSRVHAV